MPMLTRPSSPLRRPQYGVAKCFLTKKPFRNTVTGMLVSMCFLPMTSKIRWKPCGFIGIKANLSALRKKMRDTGLTEKYTVRELLLEMETLTQIRYSGKYGHILTEITKSQHQLWRVWGLIQKHSYNFPGN